MNIARPLVTAGTAVLLYLALLLEPRIAAFVAALTLGVVAGEVVFVRLVGVFRHDAELRKVREAYYREPDPR